MTKPDGSGGLAQDRRYAPPWPVKIICAARERPVLALWLRSERGETAGGFGGETVGGGNPNARRCAAAFRRASATDFATRCVDS